MTRPLAVDPAHMVAHLGQRVIAAAEATDREDVETAAYDGVAALLMGTESAQSIFTAYPPLTAIREAVLEFAQRLEAVFNQPAQ